MNENDLENIASQLAAERKEQALAAKAPLLARLKELGVTRVEAEYDGCGDSGCVETITAYKGEEEVALDQAVSDEVENMVYKALPLGWKIDDGSFGVVIFDVAANDVSFEHNDRYMEINTEEWQL